MGRSRHASGQAVVESLVGLAAMAVLFLLLATVHRVQDLGLRASLASRYVAFALTRRDGGPDIRQEMIGHYFDPRADRWVTRHGGAIVDEGGGNVQARSSVGAILPRMQVGAGHPGAASLRNELLFPDKGITTSRVTLAPRLASGQREATPATDPLGLRAWDSLQLQVPRHTAILSGAGHAADDGAVSARIAGSAHAWRSAAARSERAGRQIAAALRGVDAPWGRPEPEFDWLQPWDDVVPADRLGARRSLP